MAESGGTTTQLGILYQNSVGALFLGRLCTPETYPPTDQPQEVRIEAPEPVDDIVIVYEDGHRQYIQAKERMQRGSPEWRGVWKAFEDQFWHGGFQRGKDQLSLFMGTRVERFYVLDELCKRATGHKNLQDWQESLSKPQRKMADDISTLLQPAHSSDADLLAFFQSVDVTIWPRIEIERDLVTNWIPQSNKSKSSLFAILRDMAGQHGTTRKPFYSADLLKRLNDEHQIKIERSLILEQLLDAVRRTGDVLRQHRQTIGATTIHIERTEVPGIVEWVKTAEHDMNVGVILDQAGMGKTVVACDVLRRLEAENIVVLAIKADLQLTNVLSTEDLKNRLDFPDSAEQVVQTIARTYPVVVLIDQIDALSLSMARDQATLDVTLGMVANLRRIPNVCVLLPCRTFDLHNDSRLSQITISREFPLSPIPNADVETLLQMVGCDYQRLSPTTKSILGVPLHLDIFMRAIAGQEISLYAHEINTIQDLYAMLWQTVIMRNVPGVPSETNRKATLLMLAQQMHDRQQTTVPSGIFANAETQHLRSAADYLASNGILIYSPNGWTYFHQTFFDYCFAMQFVEAGNDLNAMIRASDQGLALRPQMVQILSYLRGSMNAEYLRQLRLLLNASDLRGHLSDLLLRWFGALPNPTEEEWTEIRRIPVSSPIRFRLLRAMHGHKGWFAKMYPTHLKRMLNDTDTIVDEEVIPYLASVTDVAQWEVMQLLRPYVGSSELWDRRVIGVIRMIRKDYGPDAVDLYSILFLKYSLGEHPFPFGMDEVMKAAPETCARLIRTYFDKQLDQYSVPEPDKENLYDSSAYQAKQTLLGKLGTQTLRIPLDLLVTNRPDLFLNYFLLCLERMLSLSGQPTEYPLFYVPDWFSHNWYDEINGFEGRFPWLFSKALQALIQTDPDGARRTIEQLKRLPYKTSHQLICHAYRAAPQAYASEALDYLIADQRRLRLGDREGFETRRLIKVIYPHLPRNQQVRLQNHILSYAPIWRERDDDKLFGLRWRGIEQLDLLRAIPRDSLMTKAEQRRQEWERKFPKHVTAETGKMVTGGVVSSPIPSGEKLSNRDWLRAMTVYHGKATHKHDFLKGGAYQLAGVLLEAVKREPERFYNLAMRRITMDIDDNYVGAFLDGIASANTPMEWLCNLILKFAPSASYETKCAIAWSLMRRYSEGIPDDILDLLEKYIYGPVRTDILEDTKGTTDGDREDHVKTDSLRVIALDVFMLALDKKSTIPSRQCQWSALEFVASQPSIALRSTGVKALIYKMDENRARHLHFLKSYWSDIQRF